MAPDDTGRPLRTVTGLLDTRRVKFDVDVPEEVPLVAFESENRITNVGEGPWGEETGLLSIWILGMFPPSPGATVVIPVAPGPEEDLGPVVNDAYFGKVPADRLIVESERLFFRADGKHRSKIGIPPRRSSPVCGSYDPKRRVLTLALCIVGRQHDAALVDVARRSGGTVVKGLGDGILVRFPGAAEAVAAAVAMQARLEGELGVRALQG